MKLRLSGQPMAVQNIPRRLLFDGRNQGKLVIEV
jgi:hypothetical protein